MPPLPDKASLESEMMLLISGLPDDYAKRSAKYFRDGGVGEIQVWEENGRIVVSARVRVRLAYECSLARSRRGNWRGRCSCDPFEPCAHLGALAYAARESGLFARLEAAEPAPPRKLSFRQRWTPEIEKALGRPLTDKEGHLLGSLSELFQVFRQGGGMLSGMQVLNRGFDTPAAKRAPYDIVYHDWWGDRVPSDPWEMWQYLAYDLQRAGRPIPEPFRPLTDTSAVRDAVEARARQGEILKWRQILRESVDVGPRAGASRVRASWTRDVVELRLRLSAEGWKLEIRSAPDQPFKATPFRLLKEMIRSSLADFGHLPPAQAALGAVLMATTSRYPPAWAANREVPPEIVNAAFAWEAARPAVVGPGGGPWLIEPELLTWLAAVDPKNPSQVVFELANSGGCAVPEAALATRVPECLYLAGEQIFRGPPPMPEAAIPKAVLADAEVAAGFRRLRIRLPENLEVTFHRVSMKARLECWLTDGFGYMAEEILCLRLTAVAEDPRCSQVWTGHGWRWKERPPKVSGGVAEAIPDFDLSHANDTGSHFFDFRLNWNEALEAWARPISRSFPDDFLAWRERLPAETELVVSPELSGLFGAPIKAHFALDAAPAADGGIDWFDVRVQLRADDLTLTPKELELLRTAAGRFVRLPKCGWNRLAVEADEHGAKALERFGVGPAAFDGTAAETLRFHAIQLADPECRAVLPETVWRHASERSAALRSLAPPHPPAGLTAELRPYQREGFHFLAFLAENGFGGVLADDMGLGKTVQALAWLLWLGERIAGGRSLRALVVCPKSVSVNWQLETARFAPGLKTGIVDPRAEKGPIPAGVHLVVANYAQLRLNTEALAAESWDAVILDEGQNIKNPASATARAARALPAAQRIVLTGTPIENRLLDLWSLFAFAMPGLLGAQASFQRLFNDRADPLGARSRLATRVRHFLLRRTKGQVAQELPPRTEEDVVCELEDAQQALYQAELKRARQMVLAAKTAREFDRQRFNILQSLLRLRQICCDPRLVGAGGEGAASIPSAKMEALLDALGPLVEEKNKVLVFSQFVTMLDLIAAELGRRGISHLLLTGQTENRQDLVDRFQSDPEVRVFLLSLKAAGSGLNLTAASYVILYDPWWNPAVEAQAIDRTHRIGQTNPVIAYRLLARGTVEEKIRALQREKAAMAAAVVQEESLAQVMDIETLRRVLW